MDYRTIRTLLGVVGLYATAAAAAYLFLRWYRPSPLDDVSMSAALLGLPLAASLGYLFGSRGYFQEAGLILRSVAQPSLEDGKRVVAVGRIEALGPPLKGPFTGTECVAYQYDIDHEGRTARQRNRRIRVRDYWGMAVCPYQIRTAAGPVRILAYARLEAPPLRPHGRRRLPGSGGVPGLGILPPPHERGRTPGVAGRTAVHRVRHLRRRHLRRRRPSAPAAWQRRRAPEAPAAGATSRGGRGRLRGRLLLRGQERPGADEPGTEAAADLDVPARELGHRQPAMGAHLRPVGRWLRALQHRLRAGHEVVLGPPRGPRRAFRSTSGSTGFTRCRANPASRDSPAVLVLAVAGHGDEHGAGHARDLAQALGDLVSRHAGQADVEEHDVGPTLGGHGQRRRPVVGDLDVVSPDRSSAAIVSAESSLSSTTRTRRAFGPGSVGRGLARKRSPRAWRAPVRAAAPRTRSPGRGRR